MHDRMERQCGFIAPFASCKHFVLAWKRIFKTNGRSSNKAKEPNASVCIEICWVCVGFATERPNTWTISIHQRTHIHAPKYGCAGVVYVFALSTQNRRSPNAIHCTESLERYLIDNRSKQSQWKCVSWSICAFRIVWLDCHVGYIKQGIFRRRLDVEDSHSQTGSSILIQQIVWMAELHNTYITDNVITTFTLHFFSLRLLLIWNIRYPWEWTTFD